MHASVWCSVLVFAVLVDASVDTDTGLGEDGFKLLTAANAGGRHLLSKHGRIRLHKVSKKQRKHKRISLRGTVKCGNPGKVCAIGIIAILCAFKLITLLSLLLQPVWGSVSGGGGGVGASVSYSCQAGYKLVGSGSRKCTKQGYWSPSAPSCKLMVQRSNDQSFDGKSPWKVSEPLGRVPWKCL
jgi:hypothetical protein